MGLLSALIFTPLIGAIIIALLPGELVKAIRGIALAFSTLALAISILVVFRCGSGDFHFHLMESLDWIPSLGIRYQLGVDGISLWFVVLTAVLGVVSVGVSLYETRSAKAFMALLLVLETTMLGTMLSLDMILFYTFFEASLLPVAVMIWLWGDEKRKSAAIRYFVYLFAGSILMLVGMIALARTTEQASGRLSFSIIDVQAAAAAGNLWIGAITTESLVFWAFALAFLIKSQAFPFHTWLVDSYTQAPTGALILGVLVKTGSYGLIRFCLPVFPDVLPYAAPWIMGLAVIGILYGGAVACVQTDIKRLIAFSSVSHVGFILLGIFSLSYNGLIGAVFGSVSHGVATGSLLLLFGFLYLRRRSRSINEFGGLKSQMPILAALFLIATLAAIGLPGTSAFIGEFLALLGSFEAGYAHLANLSVAYTSVAAAGVILAVVYMLVLFQRMFLGEARLPAIARLRDLKPWEIAFALAPTLLILWGGLYPSTFTGPMEASVNATRMMAVNDSSRRPAWVKDSNQIDEHLNFVSTQRGAPIRIADADLHPTHRSSQ